MPVSAMVAAARPTRSMSASRTDVPESRSAKSISSSVHHELSDTEIAPMLVMAAIPQIHSG